MTERLHNVVDQYEPASGSATSASSAARSARSASCFDLMAYDTPDDWDIVRRRMARGPGRASRASKRIAPRGHGARHRRGPPPGARVRRQAATLERRRAVLPQRRRPASGRCRRLARRGRSGHRRVRASSRCSFATSTRRSPIPTTPSVASGTRSVRARVQRDRARLRRDLRSGDGRSCTASRTRCGRSASASCPENRSGP